MHHVVRLFAASLLIIGVAIAFEGAANADQGTGDCVQDSHQLLIDYYDPAVDVLPIPDDDTPTVVGNPDTYTLGDAISTGFYGNTSNPRSDGPGVTPSLGPGPWTWDGTTAQMGASIGDFNQDGSAGKTCSDQ